MSAALVVPSARPAQRLPAGFRALAAGLFMASAALLAGCANRPPVAAPTAALATESHWEGRMSLQTQGEQAQGFSAAFELKGTPERGELRLSTPLGTVLGVLRWSPGEAVLQSGNDTRRFASIDELLAQTTGGAVPLEALLDWLNGKNTALNGWQADLSQHANGRITARRTEPAPVADLRIVLTP